MNFSLNIRALSCLLIFGVCFISCSVVRAQDEDDSYDPRFAQFMTGAFPSPHSRYCVLMDAESGRVLYSLNPHTHRAPASTTKMMAAILLIEHGKLTDTVTAPPGIDKIQESSLHLAPSEKISLEDLLYGMMLRSANDTPVAGAYYLCGSVPKFVNMMNGEAVGKIGCRDTHFVTPNGLYAPDHYSSAYDLALIARYGINHLPEFNEIVKTPWRQISRSIHTGDVYVKSTATTFLKVFPGADGVKTGFVSQAGHCFVGSATRDGWRLIAVALDSSVCRTDVMQMLSYGFANYRRELEVPKDTSEGEIAIDGLSKPVPVETAWDLCDILSLKSPEAPAVYTTKVFAKSKAATHDVAVGQVVGAVALLANGKPVAYTDAIATAPVTLSGAWMHPGTPLGTAIHAGTILLRVIGAVVLAVFAVLVGLLLHGRTITKNSRRRRAGFKKNVRGVDPGRTGIG